MRKALVLTLVVVFAMSAASLAFAKKETSKGAYLQRMTDIPLEATSPLGGQGPSLSSAAVDSFHLAWYDFDDAKGVPTLDGWTPLDINDQYGTHWQVETYQSLSGNKSMWCGRRPSGADPYCGFETLPGYGNNWDQLLCSEELAESVCISFEIFYESENGWDETFFQVSDDNDAWVDAGTFSADAPGVTDTLEFYFGSSTGSLWLRFRFLSDGNTSDQDGLNDTNGAVRLDNIRIQEFLLDATPVDDRTSTFESQPVTSNTDEHGIWTGKPNAGFGTFGAAYPGTAMVQEDPCFNNITGLVAFIDNASVEDYACGGHPGQKVTPYTHDGLYMFNEIWSPEIAVVGSGDVYRFIYRVYRDTKINALVFYVWHVRSKVAGCFGPWLDTNNVYVGPQEDWFRSAQDVSPFIDPAATHVQLALGNWDTCTFWCGVYGDGSCHSHGALFDDVHFVRINLAGPQYQVSHYFLFSDNFAADGTTTGHARADQANDIVPNTSPTPQILPGDSLAVRISNVGPHPGPEGGPAVYAYVAVWPQGQLDKTPADIEAPETAQSNGEARGGNNYLRYPYLNTITHDGVDWYCFRMDSATGINSAQVADEFYCFDMNDWVFTPCDTICYIICAEDSLGNEAYYSRTLNGQGFNFVTDDLWTALNSPMEFTILPAGGWKNGGDLLYIDRIDDRGPAGSGTVTQKFFDDAFLSMNMLHLVDRYDQLGPSSVVGNGIGSRVVNIDNQIIACYRKIIFSAGNLSGGLIGDGPGGGDEKSNDAEVFYQLLDQGPDNPGMYISGDQIGEEWDTYVNEALALRSDYINHTMTIPSDDDHVAAGEPTNPLLIAVGSCFTHGGVPDSLIAHGGCPLINDFDLLTPVAPAVAEFQSTTPRTYIISQTTPNNNGSTARVIFSGLGFEYIQSTGPGFPPARVHHLRDILLWLQNTPDEPTGPESVPYVNSLSNNYPNPFNPTTVINYSIKDAGAVTLKVYNAAGQLVRTLVNEVKTPQDGGFSVIWDGRNNSGQLVSSGVYFYKLAAKNYSETKKMVLLK